MTATSPAARMSNFPAPPVMVAIAGASGSGKSTLAAELTRSLGGLHLSLDHYYRDLSHLPLEVRAAQNFDDPAMIDSPLLASHLRALAAGHPIQRPVYTFATYIRHPSATDTIQPRSFVAVEGLFTLYFPELRPFYQLTVFVDASDDVCFARRLRRDIEERGRTPESVQLQYDATVRPCGLAFVRPLIDLADLVLEGTDSLDFKIEQVVNALRKRNLLARIQLAE